MAGNRGGALPAILVARYWDKVQLPEGCWTWTGALNDSGYGVIWDGARLVYAHRLAYQQRYGDIPDGLTIDHLCRNRACVRPDHLEAVTNAVNARRSPLLTKLDMDKARLIRLLRADGQTYREIAEQFGVTRGAIQQVCNGRTWREAA